MKNNLVISLLVAALAGTTAHMQGFMPMESLKVVRDAAKSAAIGAATGVALTGGEYLVGKYNTMQMEGGAAVLASQLALPFVASGLARYISTGKTQKRVFSTLAMTTSTIATALMSKYLWPQDKNAAFVAAAVPGVVTLGTGIYYAIMTALNK